MMPEDIEVKLSPLDEESKQALLSFVGALKEVRNSMNEIKKQLVPDLAALTQAIQSAGGGGTVGGARGIPGGGSNPNSERGPNASVATANGPNVSYPSDQAGYGSVAGAGDENSPRRSSASSAASPGAPGFAKSASWYSEALRIPRINEFNIQDYSQMAGKAVAGRAASRYEENYQQARAQGASPEDAHGAATYQAEAPGGLTRGFMSDKTKMRFGQASAAFGSTGPYVAATHNILPQMLSGGWLQAPASTINQTSAMGITGQKSGLAGGTADFFKTGLTGEGGNVSAYRYGRALTAGRNPLDPNAIGLFSYAERGAYAEASQQEGMRGATFEKGIDSYAAAKNNQTGAAGFTSAQHVTMLSDIVRNGNMPIDTAIKAIDRLGDSASNAGVSVQAMADGVQEYHAANPQTTIGSATEAVTSYANAGITPPMAGQIVGNSAVQGMMASQGYLPGQVANLPAATTLPLAKLMVDRMGSTFKGLKPVYRADGTMLDQEVNEASVAGPAAGMTAETYLRVKHTKGAGAAERAFSQAGTPYKGFGQDLKDLELPGLGKDKNGNLDGGVGGLTAEQRREVLKAPIENRQKVLEDVVLRASGTLPGGEATEHPDKIKEMLSGMGLDPGSMAKESLIGLTGEAKQFFQVVQKVAKDSESADSSGKRGHQTPGGGAKNPAGVRK